MTRRGEIWLVGPNPVAEHEQEGTRSVMVVSPAEFNELTGTPIVVPVTTGGRFARRRGFAVSLDDAGIRTRGVVRCDQPRVLDLQARNGRFLENAPTEVVDEVTARLAAIIG